MDQAGLLDDQFTGTRRDRSLPSGFGPTGGFDKLANPTRQRAGLSRGEIFHIVMHCPRDGPLGLGAGEQQLIVIDDIFQPVRGQHLPQHVAGRGGSGVDLDSIVEMNAGLDHGLGVDCRRHGGQLRKESQELIPGNRRQFDGRQLVLQGAATSTGGNFSLGSTGAAALRPTAWPAVSQPMRPAGRA